MFNSSGGEYSQCILRLADQAKRQFKRTIELNKNEKDLKAKNFSNANYMQSDKRD